MGAARAPKAQLSAMMETPIEPIRPVLLRRSAPTPAAGRPASEDDLEDELEPDDDEETKTDSNRAPMPWSRPRSPRSVRRR